LFLGVMGGNWRRLGTRLFYKPLLRCAHPLEIFFVWGKRHESRAHCHAAPAVVTACGTGRLQVMDFHCVFACPVCCRARVNHQWRVVGRLAPDLPLQHGV
jgi:hypothetical protein